jgi:hypothetical protein
MSPSYFDFGAMMHNIITKAALWCFKGEGTQIKQLGAYTRASS